MALSKMHDALTVISGAGHLFGRAHFVSEVKHFPSPLLAFCLLGFAMLTACASKRPEPEPVALVVTASGTINSFEGEPKPVLVRVFQLTADETFRAAAARDLSDDPASYLGSEIVGSPTDVIIRPRDSKSISIEIDPETRFIAAAALFRDTRNPTWRTVTDANVKKFKKVDKKRTLTVSVDDVTIRFGPIKK